MCGETPSRRENLQRVWAVFVVVLIGILRKARKPIEEVAVHFIVTVATLLALIGIEGFLWAVGYADDPLPGTRIKVKDFMFWLDLIFVVAISGRMLIKALRELGNDGG